MENAIDSLFGTGLGQFTDFIETHGEAREACKKLKNAGIPYKRIAEEIGEFPSNFSEWLRHPGSRPSIGNAVICFLNKRRQEALLAEEADSEGATDDEEDIDDQIVNALAQLNVEEPREVPAEVIDDWEDYESDQDDDLSATGLVHVRRKPKANADGFLYVCRDRPDRFKVGASRHPLLRMKQLKTANLDICLVTAVPVSNYLSAESDAHHSLRHLRVGGEWFHGTLDAMMAAVMAAKYKFPRTSSEGVDFEA